MNKKRIRKMLKKTGHVMFGIVLITTGLAFCWFENMDNVEFVLTIIAALLITAGVMEVMPKNGEKSNAKNRIR